jgi:hypothetical protein
VSNQAETTPRRLPHRLGIGFAAGYLLLAAAVYALIASHPPDDGLEWLPLVWLAMPWFKLGQAMLIPGILLNAAILYLCGVLIQLVWRARTR